MEEESPEKRERKLLEKINSHLPGGHVVFRFWGHPEESEEDLGEYYQLDFMGNLVQSHIDLEEYWRVLKNYERTMGELEALCHDRELERVHTQVGVIHRQAMEQLADRIYDPRHPLDIPLPVGVFEGFMWTELLTLNRVLRAVWADGEIPVNVEEKLVDLLRCLEEIKDDHIPGI